MKAQFEKDASFIHQIELVTPEQGMIFQLPYVPFPENPPIYNMTEYDHFRGYLHSKHLRWSYGVMRGREGDRWLRSISAKPIPELLDAVSLKGYAGIYVNRTGYPDRAERVESELSRLLGVTPVISLDGDLAYYSLQGYLSEYLGDIPSPH
jgi:phosphoglycerol transferase